VRATSVRAIFRIPLPEILFLVFFSYTALLSLITNPIDTAGLHPVLLLVIIGASFTVATLITARWPGVRGTFACLRFGVLLAAYREMDWFTAAHKARDLENSWIVWDRSILAWLRPAIESLGVLLPAYLELCYAFVYGIGVFCVLSLLALQYAAGVDQRTRNDLVDRWTTMYLAGTLATYALFPYFPSDPPRVVFPGMDGPQINTPFREFNLFLVSGYGIHSIVFPSAHVSSALAAGLGFLWVLPNRPRWGWGIIVYAVSVAVATIYGRYHYAADAAAGIAMALIAAAVCRFCLTSNKHVPSTEPRP
jgi:membrane-associated phospholipid phosphatase